MPVPAAALGPQRVEPPDRPGIAGIERPQQVHELCVLRDVCAVLLQIDRGDGRVGALPTAMSPGSRNDRANESPAVPDGLGR